MRYVRDNTGRFVQRPHYDPKELDRMFEDIVFEFLRQRHHKIDFPIPTDELTVLIERDTDDLDAFADLAEYGPRVEGVTEFRPNRKPRVRIAGSLSESDLRENRFRTTLTHEYGHVRLHGYLFSLDAPSTGLFASGKSSVIACKRDTIVGARKSDWMEWQAGYACSALLMPRSRALTVASEYLEKARIVGPVTADGEAGSTLIDAFVKEFQVSREAAKVRLSVLGLLGIEPTTRSLFA